jgi:copper resistance protein C
MRTFKAVIVLCGVIIFYPWPWVAWGHAFPDHSEPRVGAVLTASPDRVRIWFDGALEPAFSTVRVQNASGQQMDKGDGHVDGADTTLLEVGLPSLAPGTYRVIWSVVARDGHRTEGDFNFTIR